MMDGAQRDPDADSAPITRCWRGERQRAIFIRHSVMHTLRYAALPLLTVMFSRYGGVTDAASAFKARQRQRYFHAAMPFRPPSSGRQLRYAMVLPPFRFSSLAES